MCPTREDTRTPKEKKVPQIAEKTDVVVIGGGYAGALAANRLTQRDDVAVTLINPRPNFVQRIRLHQLVGGSHDAVVDAGPLGIEAAAELAELGRTVTLVCGEALGPYLHPRGRRSVAKGLAKLGVNVLEGPDATVTAVTQDAVQLSDGRELSSEMTIWTAGFGVPDLASRSGLSTDATGRLLTDETLTSVDDERIVAAGDAAAPSDLPLRMSCQAALPLGAHAADSVLSRIAVSNRPLSPRGSSVSASAWVVGPASSSSPMGTTSHAGSTSAAALARRSRKSSVRALSRGWSRRLASPDRSNGAPRTTTARNCCKHGLARRRTSLSQPHRPVVPLPGRVDVSDQRHAAILGHSTRPCNAIRHRSWSSNSHISPLRAGHANDQTSRD